MGSYRTSTGNNTEALLLTETSGTWATGLEAALPADAATSNQLASLGSISCPTMGNCTAVGVYQFMSGPDSWASQGLMVSEISGTWQTGVAPSLPANARTPNPQAGLSSVSCASAGNCTAVGSYSDNAPTGEGLLVTETAGAWGGAVEATLPGSAATQAPGPLYQLNSVSCASAGNCTAVGAYTDTTGNFEGLLLTQTAGTWATGVEAALPADAATTQQAALLTSVSCASAGNCSAVGSYNVSSGEGGGVLLTQTAGSWATGTQVGLPSNGSSAPTFLSINAISCPAAGDCSAAGWYGLTSPGGGNQGLLLSTGTTPPKETLTVSGTGSGTGTVTSSPAGIDCGSTCQSGFDIGSEVTLTATPGQNSTFDGWTGGGCEAAGVGPCQVSMNGAATVTANFALKSFLLTLQKSGSGSGSVSSAPAGIDCGSSCAAAFNDGIQVTLTASADAGSTFSGWSGGGCSGTGTCQVTTTADTTVTATFTAKPKPPIQCIVPKLKGKTLAAAKKAIEKAHCGVGKVTKIKSSKKNKGHVISQSPKVGKHLKKGSKVALKVGK